MFANGSAIGKALATDDATRIAIGVADRVGSRLPWPPLLALSEV